MGDRQNMPKVQMDLHSESQEERREAWAEVMCRGTGDRHQPMN
jgi:hypothetical protein